MASSSPVSDDPSDVLREMVSNILQHIAPEKLVRIDVDFKLDGSGKIDTTHPRDKSVHTLGGTICTSHTALTAVSICDISTCLTLSQSACTKYTKRRIGLSFEY